MEDSKLKLGFKNLSDKDLPNFGRGVISSMTTNNATFPDVGNYLKDVETSLKAYVDAIPSRNERNSTNSAIKNELKATFIKDLKALAQFVELRALGNRSILEMSGFELAKTRKRKPVLGTVKGMAVKRNGIPKMAIFSCDFNKDADLYQVRVNNAEGQVTGFNSNSSTKVEVKNLPIGVDLIAQMRMKNSHGFGPWSSEMPFHLPTNNSVPAMVE